MNFLHRLLGRICALTALIHTFTIIILRMNRGQTLPWQEPLWAWGLLSAMGAILVLVFSVSFIRRTCYGLFLGASDQVCAGRNMADVGVSSVAYRWVACECFCRGPV